MKNAERHMVRLRTPESLYFDEVYFVLKHTLGEESAILREARRVLQSTDGMEEEARRMCTDARVLCRLRAKKNTAIRLIGGYLAAAFVGSVVTVMVLLLLL